MGQGSGSARQRMQQMMREQLSIRERLRQMMGSPGGMTQEQRAAMQRLAGVDDDGQIRRGAQLARSA